MPPRSPGKLPKFHNRARRDCGRAAKKSARRRCPARRCQKMSEKKNVAIPLYIVFYFGFTILYIVFYKIWADFVISRSPVQVRPVAPKPQYLVLSQSYFTRCWGFLFTQKRIFAVIKVSIKCQKRPLCAPNFPLHNRSECRCKRFASFRAKNDRVNIVLA